MNSKNNELFYRGHLNDYSTALYVDSLLDDDKSNLTEEIFLHVQECPACKNNILDIFLFSKNPESTPVDKLPQFLLDIKIKQKKQPGTSSFAFRIAAMFIIAVLFLGIYFIIFKKNSINNKTSMNTKNEIRLEQKNFTEKGSEEETEHDSKSRTKLESRESNFKSNQNLEYMIGSQSRSRDINVISPKNYTDVEGKIFFRWESFEKKILQLKILNNKNRILFEFSVDGNSFIFKENLNPGLYYWKLEDQKELLYVGKFIVKK